MLYFINSLWYNIQTQKLSFPKKNIRYGMAHEFYLAQIETNVYNTNRINEEYKLIIGLYLLEYSC